MLYFPNPDSLLQVDCIRYGRLSKYGHPGWYLEPRLLQVLRGGLGWSQVQMTVEISKYLPDALDLRTYRRWELGQAQPHMRNYKALLQMLLKQGCMERFYHCNQLLIS